MFSGGDSSGEGVNSLNQFGAFCMATQGTNNVGSAGSSIDWAMLAAQWKQMRDNSVPATLEMGVGSIMPEAPPPPNISVNSYQPMQRQVTKAPKQQQLLNNHAPITPTPATTTTTIRKSLYEEKGEADMDMDDDEHVDRDVSSTSALTGSPMRLQPPHWYPQQIQKQIAIATPAVIPPTPTTDLNIPTNNAVSLVWNAWPPPVSVPPPTAVIPTVLQAPPNSLSNANPTAHIPSLMKLNVPNPNSTKTMPDGAIETDAANAIETAKRKLLPAWIREGLEKMEREKQKQLEQQRQQQSHTNNLDSTIDTTEEPTLYAQTPLLAKEFTVKNNSANALASDSSGNEDEDEEEEALVSAYQDDNINNVKKSLLMGSTKRTAASEADSDVEAEAADASRSEHEFKAAEGSLELEHVGKSYEQKLADLMIVVRRTLTELLLEVTNDEISTVAQETIKSCRVKASSAQVIRKSALSSITGKLGLAAYVDSSSDEDDSNASDNDKSNNEEHDNDSEEELKAVIRQKRRTFAKVSEEIEEHIADNAQREEQKLKYYTQLEHRENKNEEVDQKQHQSEQKRQHDQDRENGSRHSSASFSAASTTSGKSYEREFGETTYDTKLQQANGKRLKLERATRTTRFSDNKDSKLSSMAYLTQMQQHKQQQQQQTNSTSTATTLFPIGSCTPLGAAVTAAAAAATEISNNLLTLPTSFGVHSQGISNVLNAAEAVIEKASKSNKSHSSTNEHEGRRRKRSHSNDRRDEANNSSRSGSSSSTSSSTDTTSSETSVSSSSRRSKHKRGSRKRSNSRSHSSSHQRKHGSSSKSSHSSHRRSERGHHYTSSSHKRRSDERRYHHHRRHHSSDSDEYRRHKSTRTKSRSRSRTSYTSSSSRRHRRH